MHLLVNIIMWLSLIMAVLTAVRLTIYFCCYHQCPYDKILVVFRKNNLNTKIIKYIKKGKTLVIPLIQNYSYIPCTVWYSRFALKDVPVRNNVHIEMGIAFSIKLSDDENHLENAVNFLFEKNRDEIEKNINKIIDEQLRLTLASLSVEEIFNDREKFLTIIHNDVDQRLEKVGLATCNMEFFDIFDDAGYYIEIAHKEVQEAVERAKAEIAHAKEAESESNADR